MSRVRNAVFVSFLIVGVVLLVYGMAFFDNPLTGKAVLDLDSSYQQGEILQGVLSLSLKEGEFIPANSKIIFENSNKSSEHNLSDFVSESSEQGNFYIEGSLLSGSGEGYGIQGKIEDYPVVYFELEILEKEDSEQTGTSPISSGSGTSSEEETSESETEESTEEEPQENVSENETVQEEEQANETLSESGSAEESNNESELTGSETTEEETPTETDETSQETSEESEETSTEESPTETETTSSEENGESIESSDAGTEEESETETQESSDETSEEIPSAPITGGAITNFFSKNSIFNSFLRLTGQASLEIGSTLEAQVTAEEDFTYTLESGQTAKIIPGSVRTDSENLSDSDVELTIDGNQLTVSTSHVKTETGFGENYINSNVEERYTIPINLSETEFTPEQGELNIRIIYNNTEIISLSTTIEEGDIIATETTEPEENATIAGTATFEIEIAETPAELTEDERNVLQNEFGNETVEITNAERNEQRILVRFEFDEFWVENNYDASLSESELNEMVAEDRIKFLKDLSKRFSEEEQESEQIENLIGSYEF